MRVRYTLSPAQLFDFQNGFAADMRNRIVPAWFASTCSYVSMALYGALCFIVVQSWDRAFVVWWSGLIIALLGNYCVRWFTTRSFRRYFRAVPGSCDWEQWIADGRFFSKNREVEQSFPIDSSVRLTKDTEFVWLEFNDRGRARVPLSAFKSLEELREFERYFERPTEQARTS